MPTDQDSSIDSIAELRQLLFKPEDLAHQLKPYVDEILAQQVETTRHEITNTIAPVLGEAIRQVERKTEEQTHHTQQLTQTIVAQAIKRVEEVAQSQEYIAQDVGQLLARIREAELSRDQMAQQLTTTLNEMKALADSQHEANQPTPATVVPVSPPQTVISPEAQRREVVEAIYAEISHMVDESVSRATNRLEQSLREEQLAAKKAEEKSSWWLKVFVLLVAFLIFLLSLSLCVAATYFVEEMNGLRNQVDEISATRRQATQTAVAFVRQNEDNPPTAETTQAEPESPVATSTLPAFMQGVATNQAATAQARATLAAGPPSTSVITPTSTLPVFMQAVATNQAATAQARQTLAADPPPASIITPTSTLPSFTEGVATNQAATAQARQTLAADQTALTPSPTSTLPSFMEGVATNRAATAQARATRSTDPSSASTTESSSTVEAVVRLTQTPLPNLTPLVTATPFPSAEAALTRSPPAAESVAAASLIATTPSEPTAMTTTMVAVTTTATATVTEQSVVTEQDVPSSITPQPDELRDPTEPNQADNGDAESQQLVETTVVTVTRPAHDIAVSPPITPDDFGPFANRNPTSRATPSADGLSRTETAVATLSNLPPFPPPLNGSAVLTATPRPAAGSINNQPRPTRLTATQPISNATALSLTMSADEFMSRSPSLSTTARLTGTAISMTDDGLLITVTPVPITPMPSITAASRLTHETILTNASQLATPTPWAGTTIADTLLFASPNGPKTEAIIPTHTTVDVLAQYGDWYQISTTRLISPALDFVGWAPTECIKLTAPLPAILITPLAE